MYTREFYLKRQVKTDTESRAQSKTAISRVTDTQLKALLKDLLSTERTFELNGHLRVFTRFKSHQTVLDVSRQGSIPLDGLVYRNGRFAGEPVHVNDLRRLER